MNRSSYLITTVSTTLFLFFVTSYIHANSINENQNSQKPTTFGSKEYDQIILDFNKENCNTSSDFDKNCVVDIYDYNFLVENYNNGIIKNPTPSLVEQASVSLSPVADTYVNKDYPNKNYGESKELKVDGNPDQITYITFDLSSISQKLVQSAKVRLSTNLSHASKQRVYLVSNPNWSEKTITFKNKPQYGSIISEYSSVPNNSWIEVDVTSAVNSALGKKVSFAIVNSDNKNKIVLKSKEASTNKPALLINFPK